LGKNVIFLAVLAALAVAVSAGNVCEIYESPSGGGERLYIFNWTYYTPDSVIEKFEKEYGVTVIYDEFASNGEMFARLRAEGGRYDVVFPSGDYVSLLINEGMLERIDKSKLSNLGNIDPSVLQKATYDRRMEYSVPYYFGAAGIIVNTARVPDFERSWSVFGRQDLRGRMTVVDNMREVMGGALAFLGCSVNTRKPVEIAAARDLINNIWKPNLTGFDADYSFGRRYANGDLWVVYGYAEVVFEEITGDTRLMRDTVFFVPEEGGPAYIDSMCIPKGAGNIDLAHTFINFIHRPDIYAEFVDTFRFPSAVNVPARRHKTGGSCYSEKDLAVTEILDDPGGAAIEYYNDAWFGSIRVGD
jgi:spermidine/putrescine transport system substrate-binding protein